MTPTTYTVQIVCAWCKKLIRTEQWPWDAGVSHGMCTDCSKSMEGNDAKQKDRRNVHERPA